MAHCCTKLESWTYGVHIEPFSDGNAMLLSCRKRWFSRPRKASNMTSKEFCIKIHNSKASVTACVLGKVVENMPDSRYLSQQKNVRTSLLLRLWAAHPRDLLFSSCCQWTCLDSLTKTSIFNTDKFENFYRCAWPQKYIALCLLLLPGQKGNIFWVRHFG